MTSLLLTDGYKFSMGEAGWPLRTETFYSSHRKGGLQVVPFDLERELKALLPTPTASEWAYLASHEYEMGAGFRAAMSLTSSLRVRALPALSIFHDREPIFSITGPSGLVSWLEPLVLMWSYRIQIATTAVFRPESLAAEVAVVTCDAQRELILKTLDAVGVKAPEIRVDAGAYMERVRSRVSRLVEITGSATRLFEVGLRAATCPEQHLLALEACRDAGLTRTSNVAGAQALGMVPVGTMGHEHVQRYGSDDAAFRAMVERRHQRSSFLLDTFDTITSGLPMALELIKERGDQGDSIRYDSGDKELQYRRALELSKHFNVHPIHILEDGFDEAQTARFEQLRKEVGVPPERQVYGYGGFLVAQTAGTSLTRDKVAAVYKLSQSGKHCTMKFGNEAGAGKQSIPGRPVLFRRRAGASGPFGVVGQEGERVPDGYFELTGSEAPSRIDVEGARAVAEKDRVLAMSKETQSLMLTCRTAAFGR